MAVATPASTPLRCSRHRNVPTTLSCDRCGRPYCRDCVVSRFITSRSAVWLCRPCAGVRGAGGSWNSAPLPPSPAADRDAWYWWVVLGLGALVLYLAYQQGLLPL